MSWIKESDTSKLPIMFLLSSFFATIPVVPYTLFAGIMGAKYGIWIGLLINWWGGVTASLIYFLSSRYLFADYFRTYIQKFDGIHKFNGLIEKNAFITILFARMVPIVPPPVVNIYSGLTKMSFLVYLTASAIGKVPPMFMFAFGGSQLFSSIHNLVIGLLSYLLFLLVVYLIYRIWTRNKE